MKNYVYILSCADGTFYTGWTTHLEERVKTHNQGKGAKYTRSRLPVKLLYWEEYSDKGEALRREAAIKKMSRKQKEEL
ncbi:MAG: GIY-YIG nuclease family protein, partial [Lachnospiraceae bacterium]|nr:GIY-YIG nuclease family protein [Lachnospiraceae bacterium]